MLHFHTTVPTTRDICYCVISVSLGAYCLLSDPSGIGPTMEPWVESCSQNMSPQDFAAIPGNHIYDPTFGFGFMRASVCIITQLLYKLNQHSPPGSLLWMTTYMISLPVGLLMAIEAGRKDAKGPVRYPMILALLSKVLGISIVFPMIWIPSWILGRGTGGIDILRLKVAVPTLLLPGLVLSVLVFWLNPATKLWTSCAAIIGGPAICFLNAFYWTIPDPDPNDPKIFKKSNDFSAMAYAISGAASLFCWLWLIFINTIPHYGFSLSAIYNDIWAEAPLAVIKFMTIDAVVLFLAGLIVLAYHNELAALEGMALSLCFGPGAGVALVLAGLAVDDEAQLKLAQKTADAKMAAKVKDELGKKD